MKSEKVGLFMQLAGQTVAETWRDGDAATRRLAAQLLLSEVLEYVVHGLGVVPELNGTAIDRPNGLQYRAAEQSVDRKEMLDGLSDVAYTMYWNALAFGVPLDRGFELVCDNNLTKFVRLSGDDWKLGPLPRDGWHVGMNVVWPSEVESVTVVRVCEAWWAVGKDAHGKVRKPSTYQSVDLTALVR